MKIGKDARIAHEVHVKAKLSELYDFDQFTRIQRNIVDDLGCTACTSGVNMRFDIERYFGDTDRTVNKSKFAKNIKTVRVIAPRAIANSFETNVAARREVLRELGHPACTSGYNILFEDELAFAVGSDAKVMQLG